jgi:hypothetical protein
MAKHVHQCIQCHPEIIPEYDKDDPRYKRGNVKTGYFLTFVDDVDVGYTMGVYTGEDGWAIVPSSNKGGQYRSSTLEDIHDCPNCIVTHADGSVEIAYTCIEIKRGFVRIEYLKPVEERY